MIWDKSVGQVKYVKTNVYRDTGVRRGKCVKTKVQDGTSVYGQKYMLTVPAGTARMDFGFGFGCLLS